MAEQFPDVPLSMSRDAIETLINQKFDQLIDCLNTRREQLITAHRERQEERRAATTARNLTLKQLTDSRSLLQTGLKDNVLTSVRLRAVEELDAKMRQLELVHTVELVFESDTQQLEDSISVLGQLVERDSPSVPNYSTLQQFQISVGKRGKGIEELHCPEGIVFNETTKQIFVANADLTIFSTVGCIKVFSATGEYISAFGKGQLKSPSGIAINGDEIYVSDSYLHSIFHFTLPSYQLITEVGKRGTGKGEFSSPHQLATAPSGSLYIADTYNNRVVIMTDKLEFRNSISHASMRQPYDIKLMDTNIFVMSSSDDPCIHVFSQFGEKLRSFITHSHKGKRQIMGGHFFCFDRRWNILISDSIANSIKVLSQEGALLVTLGYTQGEDKRIKPTGITVTSDNSVICASSDTVFGLHILC